MTSPRRSLIAKTGYFERVDAIANKTFIEFVEQLERENIQFEAFKIGDRVSIVTIVLDPNKAEKDITIPVLHLSQLATQAGRRRSQDILL